MRQTIFILLLACTWSLLCYAQTPYDSFAPQAYRPMLELEGPNPQPDTIFSAEYRFFDPGTSRIAVGTNGTLNLDNGRLEGNSPYNSRYYVVSSIRLCR